MKTKEEIIKVLKRFLTKGIGGYYYTFSTIEQIADALHQKDREDIKDGLQKLLDENMCSVAGDELIMNLLQTL